MEEKRYYKEEIIKILGEIKNEKYLEFIFYMLNAFKKNWGI